MERRCSSPSKKLLAGLLVTALLILAGVAWLERTPLLAWYSVYRLVRAEDSDRQTWVERVAGLDSAAMPKLIDCLRQADARVCANARAGLRGIVQRWGPGENRRAHLAGCLAERFSCLSEPGRQTALEIQEFLLQTCPAGASASELLPAATRMLAGASRMADREVRARALALAAGLSQRSKQAELVRACRALTQTCLGDEAAANRLRAIRLAREPGIDLLEAVVPLLSDPVPEVRRAAMLAVGSTPAAINTDDLLRWLHDPDADVRSLCEKALRSRGLQDEHVRLGRLMTDNRPGVRLRVLDLLRQANDLEPGIWLRRLSHDPAPAVRAAAVRAATEQTVSSLTDRLEQMAQNDPCPSVRQLAQYYLLSNRPGHAELPQP